MTSDQKGIILEIVGMLLFSVQDALIKNLSSHASLIQIFLCRGIIGIIIIPLHENIWINDAWDDKFKYSYAEELLLFQ